jgi:hypothetical protein
MTKKVTINIFCDYLVLNELLELQDICCCLRDFQNHPVHKHIRKILQHL